MTLRRDTRRGPHQVRSLTWAPPTLSSPIKVTVTNDPATRYISLAAGQDLILNMPTTIGSDYSGLGRHDALVEVTGGRHVVVIGGHIQAVDTVTTTMTAAVGTTETTLSVSNTSGFPSSGSLRIDGELIYYASKDARNFLGCTRDAGFFNGGALSSKSHTVGTSVHVAESARQGIAFVSQTGTVHAEGLRIDGQMNDGVRIFGTDTTLVQLQNIRIGPTTAGDPAYNIDGHPDCIQIWRGAAEVRVDRATLLSKQGKALLNQSVSSFKTGALLLRDVEAYGLGDNAPLFTNSDAATAIYATNVWAKPAAGKSATSGMGDYVNTLGDSEYPPEFVPEGVAGVGYVSPGYLSA